MKTFENCASRFSSRHFCFQMCRLVDKTAEIYQTLPQELQNYFYQGQRNRGLQVPPQNIGKKTLLHEFTQLKKFCFVILGWRMRRGGVGDYSAPPCLLLFRRHCLLQLTCFWSQPSTAHCMTHLFTQRQDQRLTTEQHTIYK